MNSTTFDINDAIPIMAIYFNTYSFSIGFSACFNAAVLVYAFTQYFYKSTHTARMPFYAMLSFFLCHVFFFIFSALCEIADVYLGLGLDADETSTNTYIACLIISNIFEFIGKMISLHYVSFRVIILKNIDPSFRMVIMVIYGLGVLFNVASSVANTVWNLYNQIPWATTMQAFYILGITYYFADVFISVIELYTLYVFIKHRHNRSNFAEVMNYVKESKSYGKLIGTVMMTLVIIVYSFLTTSNIGVDPFNILYTIGETARYMFVCEFASEIYANKPTVAKSTVAITTTHDAGKSKSDIKNTAPTSQK